MRSVLLGTCDIAGISLARRAAPTPLLGVITTATAGAFVRAFNTVFCGGPALLSRLSKYGS